MCGRRTAAATAAGLRACIVYSVCRVVLGGRIIVIILWVTLWLVCIGGEAVWMIGVVVILAEWLMLGCSSSRSFE